MKVNGKDDIPYEMENKHVPNHQPDIMGLFGDMSFWPYVLSSNMAAGKSPSHGGFKRSLNSMVDFPAFDDTGE